MIEREEKESRTWPKRLVRLACGVGVLVALVSVWFSRSYSPEARYQRMRRMVSNDPRRAERELREALNDTEAEPGDTRLLLCLVLAGNNRWKEVNELLVPEAKTRRPALLMELSTIAAQAQQWELARNLLIEVSDIPCSEQTEALQMLLQLARTRGATAEVQKWADKLTRLTPGRVSAWWELANSLEAQQKISEAVEVYRRALKHDLPEQDQLEMRYRLADHLIFLGDVTAARKEIEHLRAQQGDSLRADVLEARVYRLEGKPAQALAILDRIWDSIEGSPRVVWLRGRVHLDLDNLQEAAADFQLALKDLPADEVLYFNLAEVYRRLGNPEKSQFYQEKYREIHQHNLKQ